MGNFGSAKSYIAVRYWQRADRFWERQSRLEPVCGRRPHRRTAERPTGAERL